VIAFKIAGIGKNQMDAGKHGASHEVSGFSVDEPVKSLKMVLGVIPALDRVQGRLRSGIQ
jgi:hypothetical protein